MKRTHTSVFDTVGMDGDVFQCEKIVGKRLAMVGITRWNVKWAGYASYRTKKHTHVQLIQLSTYITHTHTQVHLQHM